MSAQKEVLHIRAEVKPQEERTAITPENAKKLIDSGRYALHVERSPERIYKDDEYQQAGCTLVETGSWPKADPSAFIVGLKELPEEGSKSEGDNHACAEVAAFLLACEFVALLLNLAVTFPNDYDVLTGITESALFLLLARFMAEAWGGDARLTVLSLPILLFRLLNVASLLRPAVTSLLAPKQKTT
ncbi:saccharopine dehydrogenase (nad+, l-lysine forming), putative [Acanthamoeba castellanii str. Neff]|uniref:Saccharopine dehydrogenase (Nad+, l-lysine forming), putative n=1 Tax=Acanthamoeba castellanii (strain ATCC 30010 / Neff) TaxID=1257118 RepID=L8GS87_ACACF|nr:saccharopine dehydrogenase (nad+, l-lysine forming), putative [Acanthamoeba castellanii str. Neff]ELR16044.1 saccharopine dehydrogenase (nad+, l-lysine forming), putative [Acanthamoeba castellanii str. Neff]